MWSEGEGSLSLSAKELLKLSTVGQMSVPTIGVKDYAPDGSWIQAKKTDVVYTELGELLHGERVSKQNSLARGIWKSNFGKVQVTKMQGKFWQSMGHCENGVHFLEPEEALFLMDAGTLEIYHGEVPLSLKQAYATLLAEHVSMEQYQVYAHLTRFGYILQRHVPHLELTSYEQQICLNQHLKRVRKCKRKQGKRDNQERKDCEKPALKKARMEAVNPSKAPSESESSPASFHQCAVENKEEGKPTEGQTTLLRCSLGEKSHAVSGPLSLDTVGQLADDMQSAQHSLTQRTSHIPYSQWDWTIINFPSFASKNKLHIQQPTLDCLPCCVLYAREVYTFDVNTFRHCQRVEPKDNLVFSLGSAGWKGKIRASNWGEYRQQYRQQLASVTLKNSPAGCLWTGEVTPLLRPQEASSSRDILERLQILESVEKQDVRFPGSEQEDLKIRIVYDVYLPNSKFRKTMLQLPSHHLCIVRADDVFPSVDDMKSMQKHCHENVPLLWAVIDGGAINFYALQDVDLPTKITVG